MNVIERALIEDDEVGELARFDGAKVLWTAYDLRAVHRGTMQHFHRCHAAARQHPHLPVVPKPLERAMAADTDQTSSSRELAHLRGKLREGVFVLTDPPNPPSRFLVNDAVWDKVIQLCVVVHLRVFIPIVRTEWPAVVHDECRGLG